VIRAVFFDFYSVWTPDKFSYYLASAEMISPEVSKAVFDELERYYHGQVDVSTIAEFMRMKLGRSDIAVDQLLLSEASISGGIVNFIRELHGHFLKVGILANLGTQELNILNSFNVHNQLFEVIASPLSFGLPNQLLSREVFNQAMSSIGEPPESCLMISGNSYVLAFAAILGIRTLMFEGLDPLSEAMNHMLEQDNV